MTDREAIDVLFNEWKCIDRNDGIHCDRKCESCDLVMDVGIIREAFNIAISALQAQEIRDLLPVSPLLDKKKKKRKREAISAQPEPLLDEIVDEIRKTIVETESNGKYHADSVRHNGEMICHGLQIALNIIEEKRNEQREEKEILFDDRK